MYFEDIKLNMTADISKVLVEFPQFNVDVENADIVVRYVRKRHQAKRKKTC